jgi:predicted Zn-dependent protease with MMP-like domain
VEAEPTPEEKEDSGHDPDEELFGLYQGTPLSQRGVDYAGLPDKILIYRGPILRFCRSKREVAKEIRDTLIHEIGHHFGMKESELPY